jgi:hypothetical protein
MQILTGDDWPAMLFSTCENVHSVHVVGRMHHWGVRGAGSGRVWVVWEAKFVRIPIPSFSHCTDAYRYTNGSYLSILYFIVVTIIDTYILLTLFIVILLERFAEQDDGMCLCAYVQAAPLNTQAHTQRTIHSNYMAPAWFPSCCEIAAKFELEDLAVRMRGTLPPGFISPEARDAMVVELAREKTRMDRSRKLAKVQEHIQRHEEVRPLVAAFGLFCAYCGVWCTTHDSEGCGV